VLSVSEFMPRDPSGMVVLDTRGSAALPAICSVGWSAAPSPHSVTNVGSRDLRVIADGITR